MAHSNLKRMMTEEKIKLMAMWPSIIEDLTDSRIKNDILNRHMTNVLKYNAPKGKHIRAIILIYAYILLPNVQLTEENIRLARIAAWCGELMQASAIIIDDMQDQSLLRREQKCWHLRTNVGLSAITDALMLQNFVYYLCKKHFKGKDCYFNLIEAFHDVVLKTTDGQILDLQLSKNVNEKLNLDLFTIDRYECIVRSKTAYYSFVSPVIIAMHLAGMKVSEEFKQAEELLLEMGQLFQIQDDFMDCFGDPKISGKDGTDIQQGKCTWLIVMALQRVSPEQRKILEECYGFSDPEKIRRVKQLFIDLDLQNVYTTYEEESYNQLNKRMQQISCMLPYKFFLDILNELYRRRS